MIIGLMSVACESRKGTDGPATSRDTAPTAAEFTGQVLVSNSENLSSAPYASADRDLGERIALQCRACHTLEAGGATLLGPNLGGMFGRRAGSHTGFDYSAALAGTGIVWTPAALDAWLADPSRFLPGNRMAFAGIRDKEDRDALIAYLLDVTDTGSMEAAGIH
jgi:cytochrome c